MFYGIIGLNWKGPCHVYRKEIKEQREASLCVLEDPHANELAATCTEWQVKLQMWVDPGGGLDTKDIELN